MRSYGAPDKDREAEALITRARAGQCPTPPTCWCNRCWCRSRRWRRPMTALLELEDQLRSHGGKRAGRARRSGGFLAAASGAAAGPSGAPARAAFPRSAPGQRLPPTTGPRPGGPPPAATAGAGAAARRGGRWFYALGLATAAGVAGGMLAADSIRNMLGGGHAKAAETGAREDPEQAWPIRIASASGAGPGLERRRPGAGSGAGPGTGTGRRPGSRWRRRRLR